MLAAFDLLPVSRTEPLWSVGRTSRGQSGPDLVSIYPYPAYGAAVPVGSGPGGVGEPSRALSPPPRDTGGERGKGKGG